MGIGKKVFMFLAAIIIPSLLFINAWQAFRFRDFRKDIRSFEKEQESWVESNRRLISAVTVYSSPGRVSKVARGKLSLERLDSSDVILIYFDE